MSDRISFKQAVIAMERKIAALYEKAAERSGDQNLREVLLFLAGKEREHESDFSSMTDNSIAITELNRAFEEAGDAMSCFQDLGNAEPPEFNSPEEALKHAMACEKDSIVFFHSLLRNVEDPEVAAALKNIIEDEYEHLDKIAKLLSIMSREKKSPLKNVKKGID